MDETHEAKLLLRREMQIRRADAHAADLAGGRELSRAAAREFLAARRHGGIQVVAGFRPIRTEIDPTPLMEALSAAGHRLCVPVIQGKGRALRFREWTPAAKGEGLGLDGGQGQGGRGMVEGPFGVPVPSTGDWIVPGLLLVPLLAFDAAGWRLGYGGGYYDRTLSALRARGPGSTLAVGFAYAVQQVPAVPRGPADQRLDAVVTEEGWVEVAGEG
jgi:5-formyltetrahydrofolate cyclo-ligase